MLPSIIMPTCIPYAAKPSLRATGVAVWGKPLLYLIGAFALSACAPPKVKEGFEPCKRLGRMQECVMVALAAPEEDTAAKRFTPAPSGKVRMYLVRPYTQEPTKVSRILLDGKPVAELAPLTFAVLDVAPGRHRLQVQTGDSREAVLDVNASDTMYLHYQLDLLFNTTTGRLSLVAADTAQASVRQSRKVALPHGS